MQTHISSTKNSELTNKVIDKIMLVSGTIALVWILAILLVGMIAK